MFYRIVSKILFLLPEELSHAIVLISLKCLYKLHLLPQKLFIAKKPTDLLGLSFPNPVGLAAGLDKNADYVEELSCLGFGFIEVGTVTPKPQAGNKKPRLFRLLKKKALINRMGFNNKGVDYLVERLKSTKYRGIIGVNIGKNAATANENALQDYQICMNKVYLYADYIVINISSPNTPGLRELQQGDYFDNLLHELKKQQVELATQYAKTVPLLVKVAPDLADAEIETMARALVAHQMDGLIATNTALFRDEVRDHPLASEAGGLSGKPIFQKALHVQQQFSNHLPQDFPIIAVGGIHSAGGAKQKLEFGAKLVQIYTGLIYQGPTLVEDIFKGIEDEKSKAFI